MPSSLVFAVDSNSPERLRATGGIAAAAAAAVTCRPKLGATPDYLDRIISYLPYTGFCKINYRFALSESYNVNTSLFRKREREREKRTNNHGENPLV